jgi:hypothetical protein
MKNIHLIPTEKPSRLLYSGNNKNLLFSKEPISFRTFERSPQNIYITNSEEIKEGDWYFFNYQIIKCENPDLTKIPIVTKNYCKKIILTTDQDLIADGVQAIDDTFLEWFVKNPSCEKVEVDSFVKYNPIVYQIILPKPKQETLEEAADMLFDNVFGQTMNIQWAKEKAIELAKWQQKRMYSEEDIKEAFFSGCQSERQIKPRIKCWEQWFEQFKKK